MCGITGGGVSPGVAFQVPKDHSTSSQMSLWVERVKKGGLNCMDLEDRGCIVQHEAVFRWVLQDTPANCPA